MEGVWVVARSCLIAAQAAMLTGMSGGITSSALIELSDKNQTIPSQYFYKESLLSDLFGIVEMAGGIFGGLLAWPTSKKLGRQSSLTVGGILFLCGWLLISYSVQITNSRAAFLTVLLTGRVLNGLASGWSSFYVPLYCIEMSSPRMKGFFGSFRALFYSVGMVLAYFLGIRFGDFWFSYSNAALMAAGLTVAFQFLMLVATYESPRWLFSKNMDKSATKILKILRGKKYDVAKEIKEIRSKLNDDSISSKEQLRALKHKAMYHPFILVIMGKFFQQFSGTAIIIYFASQVFEEAGYSDEKAKLSTFIAIGLVRLVANIFSTVLVDYMGRRVLLLLSSAGIILSSCALGIYFFIFEHKCNNSLSFQDCPDGLEYIAIFSIVVFNIAYSIGWWPIATILKVELLPNQIRTLGISIASASTGIFSITSSLSYHFCTTFVTPKFAWWTITLIMILSVVFVIFFLPETKGRSLEEIQEQFETGKVIIRKQSNCTQCTSRFKSPRRSN